MLILPLGIIGVYTSYSRESLLDLPTIQKLAIENGFKAIGISDPNYTFWIEEVFSLQKTPLILFPAIRTKLYLDNHTVFVYVLPKNFNTIQSIGKKEVLTLRELRELDVLVFYSGKNREIFSYLYDALLTKLGMAIMSNNKSFVESVISKVDFIIPFHYTNAPSDIGAHSVLIKKFMNEVSPFPSVYSVIREIEDLSEQTIKKIEYTLSKIKDVREYEYNGINKEETYSSLLWSKIISSTKPDENIRREYNRIKELGLCEFFYKLINSFEEFKNYGRFYSNILSTSFILQKLNLIKVNKLKKVSLHYFLDQKPFYFDITVSSKKKFKEVLLNNFDDLFYRVYPVHISEREVERIVEDVVKYYRDTLKEYLKKFIVGFRVSKRIFYSSGYFVKKIGSKDGFNLAFCSKSYDVVIDIKQLEHIHITGLYPKVFDVIKNDKEFFVYEVCSPFWDEVREVFDIKGLKNSLDFYYVSKLLFYKPYYKTLVEEMINQGLPFFIEDILKGYQDDILGMILSIVWARDKKDIGINEIDLFRVLIDKGVEKTLAEKITRFVVRYKNVLGIKSLEMSKFYEFLSYARLKAEDRRKFFINMLKHIVEEKKNVPLVFQRIYSFEKNIEGIDVNYSYVGKVYEEDGRFFLPFIFSGIRTKFAEEIVRERNEKGKFRSFQEFYARVGKNFSREVGRLIRSGAFDGISERVDLLKLGFDQMLNKIVIVREEIRTLGFSLSLFRSSFDDVRGKYQCISLDKCSVGSSRVFGFVVGLDPYGNVLIQDEKTTIFVRNRIFQNLRIGDAGIFEVEITEGLLGKNFFLKNFTKII